MQLPVVPFLLAGLRIWCKKSANSPPDFAGGPLAAVQEVSTTRLPASPSGLLLLYARILHTVELRLGLSMNFAKNIAPHAGIPQKIMDPWLHVKATAPEPEDARHLPASASAPQRSTLPRPESSDPPARSRPGL